MPDERNAERIIFTPKQEKSLKVPSTINMRSYVLFQHWQYCFTNACACSVCSSDCTSDCFP